MIRFSLRCDKSHRFESWFGSGADYDRLSAAGLVSCPVCGGDKVEKDLMVPNIGARSGESARDAAPDLSAPASPAEQALAELRARVEARSENVGRNFATEARRIHEGDAPARPIIGEARPAEARGLIEDGIPVVPLPWSSRKGD
ncbi:DUF1178 family protein [Amaricoccus solimangrovi]|uniref:DUF1178 family protein n=1 Tax=Amaricoccus solimangrovi TaxID=2589815 RepID=A0A501WVE1_9RHOB|nr:DUF1178 family protein [Amaricoccus solimangrovi]TPE52275.1 DUF1178 family protein [Amaricoccus solimangrovi]